MDILAEVENTGLAEVENAGSFKHSIFRAVVITLIASFFSSPLFAEPLESPESNRCFSDQWIITRSYSHLRNEKGIEALREVGHKPLTEKSLSESAVLVAPAKMNVEDPEQAKVEELSSKKNLCHSLDRNRREALRNRNKGKKFDLAKLRDFGCSCNYEVKSSRTPNDAYYSLEWGLSRIGAPQAWDQTTGDNSIVVFVIDSGIDTTHSDLIGNLWVNSQEIANDGIDNDNNGYVDDVHGINAITGQALRKSGGGGDDNGHGTHCAGTIGASSNNGIGVTGVTWNVKIGGAKFLSSTGSGSLFHAILAIDYVTSLKLQNNVPVVATNNSWGGGGYSSALFSAIQRAGNADILFIAASGNESRNIDSVPAYPASYADDRIISVGSLDIEGKRSSFSNYGKNNTDLFAPGSDIASTYPNNRYVYMSGTSMATPHVTGAIALVKSLAQNYSAIQLKQALLETVKANSNFSNISTTGGELFLPSFISRLQSEPNPPADNTPGQPVPSPTPTATPTSTPVATPTPTPPPSKYIQLTGTVVNSSNSVISNAKLKLTLDDGKTYSATTGTDGTFLVQNLFVPQGVEIEISAEGYKTLKYNTWLEADYDLTLYLTNVNAVLEFVVRDVNAQGMYGVTINLGSYGTLTTNSNGRASLPIQFGTDYNAKASKQGCSFDDVGGEIFGSKIIRFIVGQCE